MGKYSSRNTEGDHRIKRDDPPAIALLKEEHHRFRTLFDTAEDQDSAALKATADEICLRLAVHMTIEEEILYPAIRDLGDDERDEVNEGTVEHALGKALVAEIEQLDGFEELFKSKVHVLGEETVHHIDEEDEDLFETIKQAGRDGAIDIDDLDRRLRTRQRELYGDVERDGELGATDEAVVEEVETVR